MKQSIPFKFFLYVSFMFLTGCASLTPWLATPRVHFKDTRRAFETDIPLGWMRNTYTREFLITHDGVALNAITVERRGVEKDLESTKKKFDKDMLPQDLAEVEMDNIRSGQGVGQFRLLKNSPAELDGIQSFVIEYTYQTEIGLTIHGIHYGCLKGNWVYRVRYEAPEQHYFKIYENDFKKFVAGLRWIEKDPKNSGPSKSNLKI